MTAQAQFDAYADCYDDALSQGLRATGEDKDYFARGRIEWLRRCLNELGHRPTKALDFGCGTGASTPHLQDSLGVGQVVGVDVSADSLRQAEAMWAGRPVNFCLLDALETRPTFDLAFCNGVFHHIPVADREASVQYISDRLLPGGFFAFWENNPWNPGTRYVMSKIPFDRDAILVFPREASRLLTTTGLEIVSISYYFVFPRLLSWMRTLEPILAALPLGAQYQVLARKPMA